MLQNGCFYFLTHVEATGLSVRIPAHEPVIGNCVVQGLENRPPCWEQENSCALSSLCHLRTQWQGRHLQAKPPRAKMALGITLYFPEPQKKCLLFTTPHLWYSSWKLRQTKAPVPLLSDFRVQGKGSSFQITSLPFPLLWGNAGAPLLHDYSLLACGI